MADDPNDDEILEVLERVFPKWSNLQETIKTQIEEVLKARETNPEAPQGNYLERQNAMLLAELLKLKKGQSTPELSGQPSSEPDNPPVSSPTGRKSSEKPNPKPVDPAKPKAFWR